MATQQDQKSSGKDLDESRRDGFAAMGILAVTIVFIVVVVIALI